MHDKVIARLGIPGTTFSVPVKSTQSRIYRNAITVNFFNNQRFPMLPFDPVILQIVLWKQEFGQPMNPKEGLEISNS